MPAYVIALNRAVHDPQKLGSVLEGSSPDIRGPGFMEAAISGHPPSRRRKIELHEVLAAPKQPFGHSARRQGELLQNHLHW